MLTAGHKCSFLIVFNWVFMRRGLSFHQASTPRLIADVVPSVCHLAAGRWRLQALISALKPLNKDENTKQVPVILHGSIWAPVPTPSSM